MNGTSRDRASLGSASAFRGRPVAVASRATPFADLLAPLAMLLALAGCAGTARPAGPVVSPTGVVFEPGTPPADTRYSQTAALYLRSANPARAVEFAEEGIRSDPGNPVHYFLAGAAYARLGRYGEASSRFTEAERIFPAYALDVEPEREAAWADAFNRGVEAFSHGDVDGAEAAWRDAALIHDLRPEAHRNLAALLTEQGDYSEAADIYGRAIAGLSRQPLTRVLDDAERRSREESILELESLMADVLLTAERYAEAELVLKRHLERDPGSVPVQQKLASALIGQGRYDQASQIYDDLLSEGALADVELFSVGVALFRAGDFGRSAEAFGRLVELRPGSRDAWFNYANALFAAEKWSDLVTAASRLLELDPLNENVGLIVARAHLELGDEAAARRSLRRIEAAPVYLDGLVLRRTEGLTRVQGRITGNTAEAGASLRLRFTFLGGDGVIGTRTVTVTAPRPGESRSFEVVFSDAATAYRYAIVTD